MLTDQNGTEEFTDCCRETGLLHRKRSRGDGSRESTAVRRQYRHHKKNVISEKSPNKVESTHALATSLAPIL